jgi:cytochrome c biogenesis protein CcmG/thiol:disulfide interchange protein DsbE
MMKKFGLLVVVLCIVSLANAQEPKKGIEKILGEQMLPDVTIADVDGKKINIPDLGKTGKITVLSFWATWCIPCKKELTNISDLYEEWQKKYNVQLVAVSIDDSRSAGKVKPYIESQKWTYQVLLDVNQDLKRGLNIQSVPFTVLVDSTGKVVSTHSGYVEGDEFELEKDIEKLVKK